ncbi:MAG: YkgJ family cysteine cluster protein [Gammaproteobacteria bacterium]|nr:YkgJ family cysteine cluster protein [Gammaproteobacteria bacterium]
MSRSDPCRSCGACCAALRVSFHWSEGDDVSPAGVPAGLTEPVTPHLRAMRGTNQPRPRCIALAGEIGRDVRCTIYPRRGSTCREFAPSWRQGVPNPHCDAARALWDLPPLIPGDQSDCPRAA